MKLEGNPAMLIVGGDDTPVITPNRAAPARLRAEASLEEPGTLEAVARLAPDWFARHLAGAAAPQRAPRRAS